MYRLASPIATTRRRDASRSLALAAWTVDARRLEHVMSSSPTPLARMVARVGACRGRDVMCDDLHARRREYIVPPTGALVARLRHVVRDDRDLPLVFALVNVLSTVPITALALVRAVPSHFLGACYLAATFGVYLQRFVLALHYSTHASAFRQDRAVGRALNAVAPVILAPFFGIPSGVYALHHSVMHHVENNAQGRDLSSTEGFARDSVQAFLLCWARFTFGSFVELPMYAIHTKRYGMAAQCVAGFIGTYVAYSYVASLNATAAFWIFIAPYGISSFALMFGNWSQHIFVDPDKPNCKYRNSYCAINHPDNQLTFNDGYHTIHHLNSKLHWAELPEQFVATLDQFAKNDGLIFDGVGFFDVGIAVMCGRLHWLADRYVNVGQPARSREEIVVLLKHRLKPVPLAKKYV